MTTDPDRAGTAKRRVGFGTLVFAVFAALFGLGSTTQAEDRGRDRGAERGEEERERGTERGSERGRDRPEPLEGSQGHDVDSEPEEERE